MIIFNIFRFYRTYKDDTFRLVYVSFYNSLSCFAIGLQMGLTVHEHRNKLKTILSPFKVISLFSNSNLPQKKNYLFSKILMIIL